MTKRYATDYSAAGALSGAEIVQVVQTGADQQLSLASLLAWIVGKVNVWTKNQSVTDSKNAAATGTITLDASVSNNHRLLVTGNLTLANPTNLTDGMVLNITLVQNGTGGFTYTFGSKFKWAAGAVPVWTTSANAISFISAKYDSTLDVLLCNGGTGYA